MEAAASSSADLVRQLLLFSRAQPAAPQTLRLPTVLGELRALLGRSIGEHITLDLRLDPDTAPVLVDRSRFEQVVVNLVVNARDAMPGGGTVTVETTRIDASTVDQRELGLAPGAYVCLSVSDTGSGMSKPVLEHALDPFFTTKPRGQGTGLGLATVYGIVTQAGGGLRIVSEPGSGTRMLVYLPVADAHLDAPKVPDQAVAVQPGHETVLVVEDEPAVLDIARRILAGHGYDVRPAAGPEARWPWPRPSWPPRHSFSATWSCPGGRGPSSSPTFAIGGRGPQPC